MAHDKGEGWIGHSIPCTKCDCQKFDRQIVSGFVRSALYPRIPGQESLSENFSGNNSRIPGGSTFFEISPSETGGGVSITPADGNPKPKNTVSTPGAATQSQST
jgi:hypothetical protein